MFCVFTSPYDFQLKYKSLNTQVKSNNLVFAGGGGGGGGERLSGKTIQLWIWQSWLKPRCYVVLSVFAPPCFSSPIPQLIKRCTAICWINVTLIKHMSIWKLISIFEQLQGDR